ncbi:hypothetical protein MMC25_007813 [Agyrium rufum]|nr:hypothetical protein [Agyrium rufum]
MLLQRSRTSDVPQLEKPPNGPCYMNHDQVGEKPSSATASSDRLLNHSSVVGNTMSAVKDQAMLYAQKKDIASINSHREWKGKFLDDLRTNQPARPAGSRPFPGRAATTQATSNIPDSTSARLISNSSSKDGLPESSTDPAKPETSNNSSQTRTPSSLSQNRDQSSISVKAGPDGRPLVREPADATRSTSYSSMRSHIPTIPYSERGDRWMERQEAHSLRIALEHKDLQDDHRIHEAAQEEASELVRQHRDPKAVEKEKFAPYDYKAHMRQGSYIRTQSVSRYGDLGDGKVPAEGGSRSASDSSTSSKGSRVESLRRKLSQTLSPKKRDTTGGSVVVGNAQEIPEVELPAPPVKKETVELPMPAVRPLFGARRRSSGNCKSSNGTHPSPGPFSNPDDRIYEEPEEVVQVPDMNGADDITQKPLSQTSKNTVPAKLPTVKNIFDRSARQARFSRHEIHRNPPSQSRNAAYTNNATAPDHDDTEHQNNEEAVPTKNGVEIRSDEIRAATSMRLKDRSPKLPTPSVVSDRPGRPIVSFDPDYMTNQSPKHEHSSSRPGSRDSPVRAAPRFDPKPPMPISTASAPVIPTLGGPNVFAGRNNNPAVPSINVIAAPKVPMINISESPTVPVISISEAPIVPSISVSDSFGDGVRSIPSIHISKDTPSISITSPPVPTICVASDTGSSTRPLPTITATSTQPRPLFSNGEKRPLPRKSATTPLPAPRSHWTPTSSHRATAQCAACVLPIAGRIVSAAKQRFHPACFSCFTCGELLECVAFYPEPENARSSRLARITARLNNPSDPAIPEEEKNFTEADDGDESLRFFCHLDYHETFSPRCRSCKTPIEGEVIVACGREWHAGHFFCAECGDPFDSTTPFIEKDGYAWCTGCHAKRFSGKCGGCRKPILDMVVKALGKEWHEACFCCKICSSGFDDGRFFTRGASQDPICVRCEERRLKA